MDNNEAQALLDAALAGYRRRAYAELVALQSANHKTVELIGRYGTTYQLEVQAFWDGARGGNIRIMGSIDDGGIRAFVPLTSDFIMAPDGSFVGE